MPSDVRPRPLTRNERDLLRLVVGSLDPSASRTLAGQIASATVTGGIPMLLDLAVDPASERVALDDGPLPVRAITATGEVLVWLTAGALSGLEYAWTDDEPPTEMPSVESVTI
jgi:hypothetical protein